MRDVFRIQYYRTSTLTLGPEALLDYEESRKASNNRPGTGLPPGNDAEIVPETVGASSRPEV